MPLKGRLHAEWQNDRGARLAPSGECPGEHSPSDSSFAGSVAWARRSTRRWPAPGRMVIMRLQLSSPGRVRRSLATHLSPESVHGWTFTGETPRTRQDAPLCRRQSSLVKHTAPGRSAVGSHGLDCCLPVRPSRVSPAASCSHFQVMMSGHPGPPCVGAAELLQNSTTLRIDSPACIRSNARLMSSSAMVWVMRGSMSILPTMYQSTIFGTSVRPFAPSKAVPRHTRPVTSWKGRVAISCAPPPDARRYRVNPRDRCRRCRRCRYAMCEECRRALAPRAPSCCFCRWDDNAERARRSRPVVLLKRREGSNPLRRRLFRPMTVCGLPGESFSSDPTLL